MIIIVSWGYDPVHCAFLPPPNYWISRKLPHIVLQKEVKEEKKDILLIRVLIKTLISPGLGRRPP